MALKPAIKIFKADICVRHSRILFADQKTDRVNEQEYASVIEDKCSGAIPFFEREGGEAGNEANR